MTVGGAHVTVGGVSDNTLLSMCEQSRKSDVSKISNFDYIECIHLRFSASVYMYVQRIITL